MSEAGGPQRETRRVLVTHADGPIGRRLVKRLNFDASIEGIVALGAGPKPRGLDRLIALSEGRIRYARVDLTRHRPVNDLFHSEWIAGGRGRPGIDTVVHVPSCAEDVDSALPSLAGVPDRTTEARLVLQHCLEVAGIRQLIAIGSAYVYQLRPGNANRVDEQTPLDLDPDLSGETRSWVDCDMLFHGELGNPHLRVALLRVPGVVGSSGHVFLNPLLSPGAAVSLRSMGFDPMCALLAEKDLCRAIHLVLRRRATGIYNIAGPESVPLSMLARWTGTQSWPVPGPLLRGLSGAARALGAESIGGALDPAHSCYGFTLDTTLAERELGFRPSARLGPGRGDDGRIQIQAG